MSLNSRVTSFCTPYCDVIHSLLNKEIKTMTEQKKKELTFQLVEQRLEAAIEYAKYLADNYNIFNDDYWTHYDIIRNM